MCAVNVMFKEANGCVRVVFMPCENMLDKRNSCHVACKAAASCLAHLHYSATCTRCTVPCRAASAATVYLGSTFQTTS